MFLDDSDNIDDFEDRVKQVLIKYGLIWSPSPLINIEAPNKGWSPSPLAPLP
jgi:hypothetical protein